MNKIIVKLRFLEDMKKQNKRIGIENRKMIYLSIFKKNNTEIKKSNIENNARNDVFLQIIENDAKRSILFNIFKDFFDLNKNEL